MPSSIRSQRDEPPEEPETSPVRVYESRPGRLVFIENGNTDAWIATDAAVDLRS